MVWKRITLYLIILITISSCRKIVRERYPNDAIMSEYYVLWPSKQFDGVYRTFSKDGQVLIEANYSHNELEGNVDEWYENGNIKYKAVYKKGKLYNIYRYKDINGNNLSFGNFNNGNGHLIVYDEKGRIKTQGEVVNGLKEGNWATYDNSGFSDSVLYTNGKRRNRGAVELVLY